MELQRKPLESMRWEELWDAALRIRSTFLRAPIPVDVSEALLEACHELLDTPLVVRSSAVGEDSGDRSFAGLHESLVGIRGVQALLDAVRIVWASLWSDAALLYRRELALHATKSAMAVVVQRLVATDRSGVGFGRDPRDPTRDTQIVEAVPGLCQDLVDGAVDPDRWLLRYSDGEVVEWHPGDRTEHSGIPLLDEDNLGAIHRTLRGIEGAFGWPPDIEWTGRGQQFTLLQARPVTITARREGDEQREWYLSLRPAKAKLDALRRRVVDDLIPQLKAEGRRLTDEPIEHLADVALAEAIDLRAAIHARWKTIYWDEFIPFAHGVRQLGTYYNDAVKPADAYEFINIVRHQPMIATERNAQLQRLAEFLRQHPALLETIRDALMSGGQSASNDWSSVRAAIAGTSVGQEFLSEVDRVRHQYMDVVYDGQQLDARPEAIVRTIVEMARVDPDEAAGRDERVLEPQDSYERRLLQAVGADRHDEARSVIEVARLSWQLRDDDNLLLGRIEHQLLRALRIATDRLAEARRLTGDARVMAEAASIVSSALRDQSGSPVDLPEEDRREHQRSSRSAGEAPRQIVGQPAAPGLATARARVLRTADDLRELRAGDVLVCDAIQPTMSHVVPLAAAIVERRGGMLIHGAIIARELGIPCVNGVRDAILSIADDEVVTVDGYLGIVTVGPPEFDLESAATGH
jgi:pyruvate,water dikinase